MISTKARKMAEHTPAPTPNRAVYGFAWFLFFKTLFILYLLWAFVPAHILDEKLGLTSLPSKYFALYIPILVLCALTIFAFLIYPPWNLAMQDDIDSLNTLTDQFSIKRCQHIYSDTKKSCNQRIQHYSTIFKSELFCEKHVNCKNEANNEVDNSLSQYCDCIDSSKCLLTKHPEHLQTLRERSTVPNVCDIDIADVCRDLFRK